MSWDLITGTCVQTGLLGFVIGGGFTAWHGVQERLRGAATALAPGALAREAAAEGLRTGKVLAVAKGAAGAASLAQYGRGSERLFAMRGEAATTFAAVFAGVLAYSPPASAQASLAHRVGGALIAAAVCGAVSGRLPR
jgi:hypothetical protein